MGFQSGDEALENKPAIVAAEDGFGGAFGVGHHSADVTFLVADAGDVGARSVGVGVIGEVAFSVDILEQNLAVVLEGLQRFVVTKIIAFAVGDRDAEILPSGIWPVKGESCVAVWR